MCNATPVSVPKKSEVLRHSWKERVAGSVLMGWSRCARAGHGCGIGRITVYENKWTAQWSTASNPGGSDRTSLYCYCLLLRPHTPNWLGMFLHCILMFRWLNWFLVFRTHVKSVQKLAMSVKVAWCGKLQSKLCKHKSKLYFERKWKEDSSYWVLIVAMSPADIGRRHPTPHAERGFVIIVQ